MVNLKSIVWEDIPYNHDQDIKSIAVMLLDSSVVSVSALRATTEPRHDEGREGMSC